MALNEHGADLLNAKVQWWNRSRVYVQCPYCHQIHCHGFDGQYKKRHHRAPHCDVLDRTALQSYYFIFPFDEDSNTVGYEIDKARALFVSGNSDPHAYFRRWDHHEIPPALLTEVKARPRWTEATRKLYYEGEEYTTEITRMHSEMIFGKIELLRQYLDTSPEADLFLHGINWWKGPFFENTTIATECSIFKQTDGRTVLHDAACEKYDEIVELLLQRGADPNAVALNGITPLMEAALWGRLSNVQLLLRHGAAKKPTCFDDGEEMDALQFAKPSPGNARRRYNRSGRGHQFYKENTFERDRDRQVIALLLGEDGDSATGVSTSPDMFSFIQGPTNSEVLTMVASFNIPRKQKCIGVLHRGDKYGTIAAMSGWIHSPNSTLNVQIGGRAWTHEVRKLCHHTGHTLPPNRYDQGNPGNFYACHAEKQLAAYFISRHVFPWDVEELSSVAPPVRLTHATIMISQPICFDCEEFVRRVNDTFGLNITILSPSSTST